MSSTYIVETNIGNFYYLYSDCYKEFYELLNTFSDFRYGNLLKKGTEEYDDLFLNLDNYLFHKINNNAHSILDINKLKIEYVYKNKFKFWERIINNYDHVCFHNIYINLRSNKKISNEVFNILSNFESTKDYVFKIENGKNILEKNNLIGIKLKDACPYIVKLILFLLRTFDECIENYDNFMNVIISVFNSMDYLNNNEKFFMLLLLQSIDLNEDYELFIKNNIQILPLFSTNLYMDGHRLCMGKIINYKSYGGDLLDNIFLDKILLKSILIDGNLNEFFYRLERKYVKDIYKIGSSYINEFLNPKNVEEIKINVSENNIILTDKGTKEWFVNLEKQI